MPRAWSAEWGTGENADNRRDANTMMTRGFSVMDANPALRRRHFGRPRPRHSTHSRPRERRTWTRANGAAPQDTLFPVASATIFPRLHILRSINITRVIVVKSNTTRPFRTRNANEFKAERRSVCVSTLRQNHHTSTWPRAYKVLETPHTNSFFSRVFP